MTPEELSQRIAVLGSQRRARKPADFLQKVFSTFVGGTGGILGGAAGAGIFFGFSASVAGAFFGLLPGLAVGFISTLLFNGGKVYLSFLYGAVAGLVFSPIGIIIVLLFTLSHGIDTL